MNEDKCMNFTYEVLDTSNNDKIIEYEKALYRAFVNTEIKTLDQIWIFNHDEKRLRTIIPYESQKICIARNENNLTSGIAINLNIEEPFQLEMQGFKVVKTKGVAEGLGIFNFPELTGYRPVALILKNYAFKVARDLGIHTMYGTCSQKKLRGYLFMGWKLLEEKIFKEEKKFLLEVPLSD